MKETVAIPYPQVIRFCFPRGIDAKTLKSTKTREEMNNVLYGAVGIYQGDTSLIEKIWKRLPIRLYLLDPMNPFCFMEFVSRMKKFWR